MMASLRTWLWAFNLVLLAAAGYTAGLTTAEGLRHALVVNTPAPIRERTAVRRPQQQEDLEKAAFEPILEANVFNARRSERTEAPAQAVETVVQAPQGNGQASLELTLNGVMITPRLRFAMVAGPGGRQEEVYRLGECIPAGDDHPTRNCRPDQAKLTAVAPREIKVLYHQQTLAFELNEESQQRPPSRRQRAQAALRRAQSRPSPATDSQAQQGASDSTAFPSVRQGDTIQVQVPNTEVEKAFENFSDILRQARVVPYSSQDLNGFQIRRIQPNSIFQRIGLQNMDVIKSVNGEPISTADQALRLLTMFRNEKEINLDIRRRNEDLQLNYLIQ